MVNLFKERNILSHQKIRNLKAGYSGWYSREEIDSILKKEKNRSIRNGLPISYVVLDLSVYSGDDNIIDSSDYIEIIDILATLITENSRDYDIKCLINPYKIGVILLDTSLDDAKIFIEKISSKTFEYFKSHQKKEFIKIIRSIVISSYPLDQIENYEKIEGSPTIIKNFLFRSKKESKSENFKVDPKLDKAELSETENIFIDWNVKPSTNGTISLDAPIFLDFFQPQQKEFIYYFVKRIIDILGSIVGILLFTPVMIITALAIKITSKGPIIFKQTRVGKLGKRFSFYKFRTMYSDCDEGIHKEYVKKLIEGKNNELNYGDNNNPLYKIADDPRVTKVGKILRKTSIDELPQFFNVLVGSMSLVGPRPPIPYEIESYKNWHLRRIQDMKPGITGLWQAYARSQTSFEDMVRLDIQYVNNRSIILDFKILLKTISAVFASEGAY